MTEFQKTPKQKQAISLLSSKAKYIMLYGGSRSGKTFISIYAIIVRASKCKSRHVILRNKFNHAKTSIWLDTLPKVLNMCFPDLVVLWNKSDYYISLPNGSEVWVSGLDDSARVEKILGKEYSTIFFNECSQIEYDSVQIALTRLAEKNSLSKKVYYDENPPSKKHWSYWQFIKLINPKDDSLLDPSKYAAMVMNPTDNMDNIDQEYVDEILGQLTEKQKKRFLLGEFADDDDGQVYYSFKRDNHILDVTKMVGTVCVAIDFNVTPFTAVVGQYINGVFNIFDEIWLENSDTYKMSHELIKRGYAGALLFPDSTGRNRKTSGMSDFQILKENGFKIESTHNPLIVDRVNNVNRLLQQDRVKISPKCKKLIADLERIAWKDGKPYEGVDKMLGHITDALGYWLWKIDPIKPVMQGFSAQKL